MSPWAWSLLWAGNTYLTTSVSPSDKVTLFMYEYISIKNIPAHVNTYVYVRNTHMHKHTCPLFLFAGLVSCCNISGPRAHIPLRHSSTGTQKCWITEHSQGYQLKYAAISHSHPIIQVCGFPKQFMYFLPWLLPLKDNLKASLGASG